MTMTFTTDFDRSFEVFYDHLHGPFIKVRKNHEGGYCLYFHNFNTIEIIDGWNADDVRRMNNTITMAQEYANEMNQLNGKS